MNLACCGWTLRLLLVVALAVRPAACQTQAEGDSATAFRAFKARYNRTYSSVVEETARFANFRATLALIAKRNRRGTLGQHAINRFADMSQAEFRARYLSGYVRRTDTARKPLQGQNHTHGPHAAEMARLRASSIDWREHSPAVISRTKDQGQCGSCWAFSATEQIESDAALASSTAVLTLSPQQITSCDRQDDGCGGGDPQTAFEYVANAGGIESERSYPYRGTDGRCQFSRTGVQVTIEGSRRIDGEPGMLSQMQNSPMSVCVDASEWSSYSGGVMGAGCGRSIDHCVQAIGYSDGYWIVRNSWGEGWGHAGMIYIKEGVNACGIGEEPRVVTGARLVGPSPAPAPTPPVPVRDDDDDGAPTPSPIVPTPAPAPPPIPPSPAPSGSHYGDPFAGACSSDEVNVTVVGNSGSAVCAPACPAGTCPADKPGGVLAPAQCTFNEGPSHYCALMCTADAECGDVGMTCKPFMGLGACMYDGGSIDGAPAGPGAVRAVKTVVARRTATRRVSELACWDRPSCASAIARYRAAAAVALPRGVAELPIGGLWHHFMQWLEHGLVPQLPDLGGEAAPLAVKQAINYCPNNGAFDLVPIHVGTVFPGGGPVVIRPGIGMALGWNPCFDAMTVTFIVDPTGAQGYINFERGKRVGKLSCDDYYGVSSKFGSKNVDITPLKNPSTLNLTYAFAPHELADVRKNGLAVNVAPCGLAGTVTSGLATAGLFVGLNKTAAEENNKAFLVERGLFPPFVRFDKITPLDETLIKSGDVLQVLKLDGLDPLIAWGTGGRTGHTTIAVWEGETLYVCESTDASPTGAYWPPPYGIIRHEWGSWIDLADKAGFSVVVLPLSTTTSAEFDEAAYWKWFYSVQGMPYGYHVMLYSFLDTNPGRNLPKPIDDRVAEHVYRMLDSVAKHDQMPIGANLYSLIIDGMNKRLNLTGAAACTGNSSLNCMDTVLSERNLTFTEVTAMPEQDTWRYDASPSLPNGNYSMMCSAFVANALKVALGSHWPALNAHEFTPKDVYQLAIYDASASQRFTLQNCPDGLILDASGRGSYCQLLGPYVLPLNGYNSVPVTAHMNENCAAQWPEYETVRPC